MPVNSRGLLVGMLTRCKHDVGEFMCAALEAGLPSATARGQAIGALRWARVTPEGTRLIVRHLSDPDRTNVVPVAAEVSGALRIKEAVPVLSKMLWECLEPPSLAMLPPQVQIVNALGEIGHPDALPALEATLAQAKPTWDLARLCRKAIKKIKASPAPAQRDAGMDKRRQFILRQASEIEVDGKKLSPAQAVPILTQRLLAKANKDRMQAALRLASVGVRLLGTPQYDEILRAFETSSDDDLRFEALRVLLCAGGPKGRELLAKAHQDSHPGIRRSAQKAAEDKMLALELSGPEDLTEELSRWKADVQTRLASSDLDDQLDALDEAAKLGPRLQGTPVVAHLKRLFDTSKHAGMRRRALTALVYVERRRARDYYKRGMADREFSVRNTANGLARMCGEKERPLTEINGPVTDID